MNNNEREEEINDVIYNYITYSREYLLFTNNMLGFTSRNDERLYNLISLYLRNNQVNNQMNNQIHRFNEPIINNTSIPAPSMTNNMHRNNNSNRNRRNNNSRTTTRNVRHRTTNNRNTNFNNGLYSGLLRPDNTLHTVFTGTTNPMNINNERLGDNRGFSEIFIQAINGLNNLESVPIFPTDEQISIACEDISFNTISNPINNSCPINLERFTINSTVTQILYCGHCYDPTALRRWFRSNVRCPICRYDIRDYNPMDIIRNPYRRILNNPNLGSIERPNQSSPIIEPIIERNSESTSTPNLEPIPSSESTPNLEYTPSSEPIITPNPEPPLDINIESTILNETDLSFSSLPENYNILHENNNENNNENNEEYTINDFINNNINNVNNVNEIANVMRDNLNSMIINDLSNNLNNNANLIFSDLSNNGQGPILDLSYQIFFN